VGYGPTHDLRIIDFGAREDAPYRRITLIDDYRAIAMFYSNRGAEELRSGRYDEAVDWLRSAVAIDPDYAGSWVNLGVALRRGGDLESAERAYRTALEVDLHSTSALQNLAALLHFQGHEDEALDLLAFADRSSNRNPFTYITLGDLSMRHGRLEEAGRFYRKALRRQGENAESLAAMGLWTLERGDKKGARSWLRRAEGLDPESGRVALLRRRLGA
jgi:Flp pilus assembly protein TadD